jgi:hypothetical protein
MPIGSYGVVPKGMAHFAWSRGDTIIQVHGTGPFRVDFLEPPVFISDPNCPSHYMWSQRKDRASSLSGIQLLSALSSNTKSDEIMAHYSVLSKRVSPLLRATDVSFHCCCKQGDSTTLRHLFPPGTVLAECVPMIVFPPESRFHQTLQGLGESRNSIRHPFRVAFC